MAAKTPDRLEAERIMKATKVSLVRFLRRAEHELNLPEWWKPVVTMKATRGSWGGTSTITISTNYVQPGGLAAYRFKEYPRWQDDPVIGGFTTTDRWAPLRAIVAHELAHSAQHVIASHAKRRGAPAWHRAKDWETSHGDGWRFLYAKMRHHLKLTQPQMAEAA